MEQHSNTRPPFLEATCPGGHPLHSDRGREILSAAPAVGEGAGSPPTSTHPGQGVPRGAANGAEQLQGDRSDAEGALRAVARHRERGAARLGHGAQLSPP